MKKAGIILLCLQVVALFGGFVNGYIQDMLSHSHSILGIIEVIGYCLPAIIGVILLIIANKKKD